MLQGKSTMTSWLFNKSIIYEGLFLKSNVVNNALRLVRPVGFEGFEFVPKDYHVTTEFAPAVTHENLYGTTALVSVYSYKYQDIKNKHGVSGMNEGFGVVVSSRNPELQSLLDSYRDKNWHITCSYENKGDAVCTNQIDFSTGKHFVYSFIAVFDGFKKGE